MSTLLEPADLIDALQARGMTQAEIAEMTGSTQATICRIRTQRIKKTSYQVGRALHQLYEATMQKDADHE